MEEKKTVFDKIKILVTNANRFKPMEFRMALEGMVKEGGEDAEHLLVAYITDSNLSPDTRMDIIRVAGYLRCPSFLVPLKKVIDSVQHSRIQQEAIISVSKFNDRRALNILNQTLQRINNPMLMSTINVEISRIKENNPILALMPRFQEGEKNPKTFKVALDILKRILTPADATVFSKFLASGDILIQSGAFEILCFTGDIMHDSDIMEYYNNRFQQILCLSENECEDLYILTHHLKKYLSRYLFMVEEQVPQLIQQFLSVNDIRIKHIQISLLTKSKEQEALNFIKQIYPTDEKLKITIIEEYVGNDVACDFLFELYRSESSLLEPIIKSLLSLEKGLNYFIENFFTLPFDDQEIVVRNLPYAGEHDLTEFIKNIFLADAYRLKELLLSKVRESYEFSVKDLLFDPEKEREFYFMGQDYFDTITKLFPVTAVKRLLSKIVSEDASVSKAKKYLQQVERVMPMELIVNFKDKEFITKLFTKIINSNNRELSVMFLGILKHIKTLDIETYRNINESMALFITKRETNISPEEKGELSRIKRSFNDLYLEFKRIEEGSTSLQRLTSNKELDFELLAESLVTHRMALVMRTKPVITFITSEFEMCHPGNIADWVKFFERYPRIALLMRDQIMAVINRSQGIIYNSLSQLYESFTAHPPRIVMNFYNRHFTAILRETFSEAVPEIITTYNDFQMNDNDILLCDLEMLKQLTGMNKSLPPKIYLFMEHLEGFSEFKSLNTKNFMQPFSFYRIVKEILQNLYL
jgi:hypothetical protein